MLFAEAEGYVMPTSVSKSDSARPPTDDLTEAEAAEILHVSLSYVCRILDEGTISSYTVAGERKTWRAEVFAYRAESDARCRRAMAELVALSEELGLYS